MSFLRQLTAVRSPYRRTWETLFGKDGLDGRRQPGGKVRPSASGAPTIAQPGSRRSPRPHRPLRENPESPLRVLRTRAQLAGSLPLVFSGGPRRGLRKLGNRQVDLPCERSGWSRLNRANAARENFKASLRAGCLRERSDGGAGWVWEGSAGELFLHLPLLRSLKENH